MVAPTAAEKVWIDRVVCAIGSLEELKATVNQQSVREMVAAKFASRFDEDARLYEHGHPIWQNRVEAAVETLVGEGLIAKPVDKSKTGKGVTLELMAPGRRRVKAACRRALAVKERPLPPASGGDVPNRDPVIAGVMTPPLREKFLENPDADPPQTRSSEWPVMIELNLCFQSGLIAAMKRVETLWDYAGASQKPFMVADEYAVGELTTGQIEGMVSADAAAGDWSQRAIFRIWPDFETRAQIDSSAITVKADASRRVFNSYGDRIVWAVVDSGISKKHPHFDQYQTVTHESVRDLHRDFTTDGMDPELALIDKDGHGTHVAAIIAGGLSPEWNRPGRRVIVTEKRFNVGSDEGVPITQPRVVEDATLLSGMAPKAKLVSLKVLGEGDLTTRVSRVMRALAHVREANSASDKLLRIHGVNLSLGYEFAAEWFACGRSPLCLEVDKLVRSGVVVVAAAGNTGYITLNPKFATDVTKFSAGMTINDPGNAERAITVGSTHRDSPHTFGISYFSSRGPTGDGRCKPDLVAPGERITSAAAGKNLIPIMNANPDGIEDAAVYVEDSGTSMAAPHVSGAVAAFLSVQRELIGNPEEVKRIFVSSATSLCRDPSFQGAGLLDLMRALQAV
jgi:serine protease AprX